MTIGAFETYLAQAATETIHQTKVSLTTVAGRHYSTWLTTPFAGTAPTTAAVPSRTIAGAIGQQNAVNSSTNLRLRNLQFSRAQSGMIILCDRLSHQGGLSGTVTTNQTTNLPTAALTRYTDGVGVMAGLEIYTQIGATATSVNVSYTNQDGTSGIGSPQTVFGGTAFREASRMVILPLAAGDSGVRAVASVTVLATTGTAGNFGVTLFKPLLALPVIGGAVQNYDSMLAMNGQMPRILDDACLFWLHVSTTTSTGIFAYTANFAQDV